MNKEEQIKEIIHVFDCEDMPLDEEDIRVVSEIVNGEKTSDESCAELLEQYRKGEV
jgi:hypothetical protein